MVNTKYSVGQVICIEGNEFEITAIGRKYATYKPVEGGKYYRDSKFVLLSGRVMRDFGTSPVVYDSKAEYDRVVKNSQAWLTLRGLMDRRYSAPEAFDGNNLEEIVRLLGLEKPE